MNVMNVMNIMNITYTNTYDGHVPPSDVVLTQYMWPGFLGEFNHSTLEFIVWELSTPTTWIQRTDISAPPRSCIASESIHAKTDNNFGWTNLAPNVWRCVSPVSK